MTTCVTLLSGSLILSAEKLVLHFVHSMSPFYPWSQTVPTKVSEHRNGCNLGDAVAGSNRVCYPYDCPWNCWAPGKMRLLAEVEPHQRKGSSGSERLAEGAKLRDKWEPCESQQWQWVQGDGLKATGRRANWNSRHQRRASGKEFCGWTHTVEGKEGQGSNTVNVTENHRFYFPNTVRC